MGQYHTTYNLDKREFINPHRIDNGLKMYEQIGFMRSTSTALFLLLANSNGRGGGDVPANPLTGRWAGDRIVVQGDYAEPTDQGFTSPETLDGFTDISAQVFELLKTLEE
jgi:hypothetical protein